MVPRQTRITARQQKKDEPRSAALEQREIHRETAMHRSTLASAFAAAQPRRQVSGIADQPVVPDVPPRPEFTTAAVQPATLDAQALLNAVCRSLQSCQDTSTYRMLLLNLANAAEAAELRRDRMVD
jgi:hypothetical protein